MRHVDTALRLVFRGRGYVVAAVATTLIMGAFYAWAGQLVTFYPDGSVYVDPDPAHLAALAALALLTGLVLPVQVFAARRGAWGVRQAGTGVMGLVAGIGSLTCCSPLLIPAVLALVGFSGTTLLTVNATLYRYFAPLALTGAAFLLLSFAFSVRDITRACALTHRRAPAP